MRAVVLSEQGGPDVLVPGEMPTPTPGRGQLLIRVEASAVSSGEAQMRSGVLPIPVPLPAVIGVEAAGTVTALGEDVDPAWAGARVVAITGVGSYAEYVVANVGMAARLPDSLSSVDAVASAAPAATAAGLLHRAGPQAGETVLVEGGSGNVGGYLVRHAHDLGARVLATAGTEAGRARAAKRGADIVVDHSDPGWPGTLPEQPDVVFEMVGGQTAGRLLTAIRDGGRMLLYGRRSGEPAALDHSVMSRGLHVIGCGGQTWYNEVFATYYPNVVTALGDGRIRPLDIDVVLPLAEAADAHRRLEQHPNGRIILQP